MLSKEFNQKPVTGRPEIFRTTVILAVILVVLVITVLAISWFAQSDKSDKPLANLRSQVEIMEITRLDETNILVRQAPNNNELSTGQADKWVVANHNNQVANQQYVQEIFDTLDNLIVIEVISKNPDKQSIFQVNDSGIQVVMKVGDKVVKHFWIGKNGLIWPSSYFRFEGDDKVYLVKAILPQLFGWTEWRDMIVMQLGNDLISELKWSNGLKIVKEDGVWKVKEPKEFDIEENKIATVLNNLADLRGSDIADKKAWELDQNDVSFVLEIKTTDDVNYKLTYWYHEKESLVKDGTSASLQDGDYDYYVVREGNDTVYILSKYVAENMEKKLEFFEN